MRPLKSAPEDTIKKMQRQLKRMDEGLSENS